VLLWCSSYHDFVRGASVFFLLLIPFVKQDREYRKKTRTWREKIGEMEHSNKWCASFYVWSIHTSGRILCVCAQGAKLKLRIIDFPSLTTWIGVLGIIFYKGLGPQASSWSWQNKWHDEILQGLKGGRVPTSLSQGPVERRWNLTMKIFCEAEELRAGLFPWRAIDGNK
jgi:hypothetical protein